MQNRVKIFGMFFLEMSPSIQEPLLLRMKKVACDAGGIIRAKNVLRYLPVIPVATLQVLQHVSFRFETASDKHRQVLRL